MSPVMPSRPPGEPAGTSPATPAARPRYLALALTVAIFFGAGCWMEGCARLQYYREGQDGGQVLNERVADADERAKVTELYERYHDVAEELRSRAVPLAAGQFVLGAALLALSARGLGRRTTARGALMQLVAAQAIVVVASSILLRRVSEAELDWHLGRALAEQRQVLSAEEYARVSPVIQDARRYANVGWLTLRTVASGLVVLALASRRSRAFFESAGDAARDS